MFAFTNVFDLLSFDFVLNRFFMKLFKTNNIDVVKTCQQYFNFEIPGTLWRKRSASFLQLQEYFLQSYAVYLLICVI